MARYDLLQDEVRRWSVIDKVTGHPAMLGGEPVKGLTHEKAVEVADFLNTVESKRRGANLDRNGG